MICYRDMTFFPFYLLCKHGVTCERALLPEVWKGAEKAGVYISQFAGKPDCFEALWENPNEPHA